MRSLDLNDVYKISPSLSSSLLCLCWVSPAPSQPSMDIASVRSAIQMKAPFFRLGKLLRGRLQLRPLRPRLSRWISEKERNSELE